jgi:hypothetical protein
MLSVIGRAQREQADILREMAETERLSDDG